LIDKDICDGKFHVLKLIGSGSYGFIYEVKHNKSGKMFAAKVEINNKPVSKVKKEYHLMKRLINSKYVPNVYEIH
jgi:serine/threonine protein kinase